MPNSITDDSAALAALRAQIHRHEDRLDAHNNRLITIAGEGGNNGRLSTLRRDLDTTQAEIKDVRGSLSRVAWYAVGIFLGSFLSAVVGVVWHLASFETGISQRVKTLETHQSETVKSLETLKGIRCSATP